MSTFHMVASMNESTVVSEYIPKTRHSESYQRDRLMAYFDNYRELVSTK